MHTTAQHDNLGREVFFYGDTWVVCDETPNTSGGTMRVFGADGYRQIPHEQRNVLHLVNADGDEHGPTLHKTEVRHIAARGVTVIHWANDDPAVKPHDAGACVELLARASAAEIARQRARQEAHQALIAHREKVKAQFAAIRPAWAKAVVVAELVEDESDSMTDYYGHKTTRTVALAWSKHTRNVFSEMRKAAARLALTAELATADKSAEHRENWSMGGGYYLKDGYRHASGWQVRKHRLPADGWIDAELDLLADNATTRTGTT